MKHDHICKLNCTDFFVNLKYLQKKISQIPSIFLHGSNTSIRHVCLARWLVCSRRLVLSILFVFVAPIEAARTLSLVIFGRQFLSNRIKQPLQNIGSDQNLEATLDIWKNVLQIIVNVATNNAKYVNQNRRPQCQGKARQDVG